MDTKNTITIKGKALALLGNTIKLNQKALDFKAIDNKLEEVSLNKFKGKFKLIASVPSLDTPVCDSEIKRFNEEASKLSKDLVIIFISMDLPFAQKRFCSANSIDKIITLSDYRDSDFGLKYGVLIKELRLLARAIFIIDEDDILKYIELVPELSSPPDYDAALGALRKII